MDKYRRGVLKGIEIARNSSSGKCSKTDGLRVIRRFEEVNKCPYDHESLSHTYLVRGKANNESMFRRLKKIMQCA